MNKIHSERQERLLAAMADNNLDGVLIVGNSWQVDYLRWVADFSVLEGDAAAIVLADGDVRIFVEGPSEADRARVACPDANVEACTNLIAEVRRHLDRLGNRKLAAGPTAIMPYGLVEDMDAYDLEDASGLLDPLMMIKSPAEVEALQRATDMADRGYDVFLNAARPGIAEYELVAEMEGFFRSAGCQENFMLIGSGGVEVMGMHPASDRRIQSGDLVTTELSPCVDGYFSQICRTLVVGEPTETQLNAFTVYQDAVDAGLAVLKPGVTAAEVAKAENDVFRERDLEIYTTSQYTRVRGHGLGLFVDSKPHILEDVDTVLDEGAYVIVHPNTYHPDAGYMVLGDAALVTKDGCETYSTTPRDLMIAGG